VVSWKGPFGRPYGAERLSHTRHYEVEVVEGKPDPPKKSWREIREALREIWAKPTTSDTPSFDLQLWLSRCDATDTWVTLMQRVRDGSPVAYDLYVYTPGDFVWNLVGTWSEHGPAFAAKDWWVDYAEQGGTYKTWLASEVVNAD
jgi:hypothetical protein